MPRNRHDDALVAQSAQDGARNPRAILGGLQRALAEMDAEADAARKPGGSNFRLTADTDTILDDAAFRLMVHQLAHLCRLPELECPGMWSGAMTECRRKAGEQPRED
jgi:hypothetical protein